MKLRRVILFTCGLALVLACIGFTGFFVISERSEMTLDLQNMADMMGATTAHALQFHDSESARMTLSALAWVDRVKGARLFDADGRLLAEFMNEETGLRSFDPYISPGVHRTDNLMIVSRPVLAGDRRIGTIVVATGTDHVFYSHRDSLIIACGVLLTSMLVAWMLSGVLEHLISNPLLRLTEAAARVSSTGDYSTRARRENNDEIGQLVDYFNKMLSDIEERETTLRDLTDRLEDGVHERTEELEREVVVRARTEDQLRASLAEKDVLLKEIHHRVKNNLQVISSLLNLQSSHVVHDQARDALLTSKDRLRSIALVHEMFYQSEDLSQIELPPYLTAVASNLLGTYGVDPETVQVEIECVPMSVTIDTAIPIGLIAHELTSNALRHAFPDQKQGSFRIALEKNCSSVQLIVTDDGVGIPGDVQWDQPTSLGLQLVHNLTGQINGQIELEQGPGTCFTVTIPDRFFDFGD